MKLQRRDRLRYWWAWNKYDVYHHCVTVAAVCVALAIGGCVFDSLHVKHIRHYQRERKGETQEGGESQ
jgi:hypothetical protein